MEDCSIVVSSCDRFKDCWKPFIFAFEQAWPGCPYEKYFISNHEGLEDSRFCFLRVGEDRKWGDNLVKGLEYLQSKYILYMQEDYWLSVPVRSSFIEEQLLYCEKEGLDYLRITFPWKDAGDIDGIHALSPTEEPYGICLQSAIWRKDFLLRLIRPGMSGWDFEDMCNAMGKTRYKTRVLLENVSKQEFHYVDAVRKGRWTRIGYSWLKKNGFKVEMASRPKEGIVLTYSSWMQTRGGRWIQAAAKRINGLMRQKNWNF